MSESNLPATIPTNNGLVRDESTYGGDGGNAAVAWVQFYSDKTKGETLERCKAAGVKVNNFYYQDALGVLALDPFRVFLLDMFEHRAVLDGDGKLEFASPVGVDVMEGDTRKWCDRITALLLVVHPAGLQPATINVVKAMCRPFQKAKTSILGTVQNPAIVGARGEQWSAASKAVYPQGRFTLKLWGGQEPPKSNPKGPKFNAAYYEVVPPNEDEVKGFNAFVSNAGMMKEVTTAFAKQVAYIQEKFDE